jgi:hypothetical protein
MNGIFEEIIEGREIYENKNINLADTMDWKYQDGFNKGM